MFVFGTITIYGILNNGRKRYNTLTLETEKMKNDADFVIATLIILLTILLIPFILFIIAYFFL